MNTSPRLMPTMIGNMDRSMLEWRQNPVDAYSRQMPLAEPQAYFNSRYFAELQYSARQNNFQVNSQDYIDMAQHFQNASRAVMFGLRPHENHTSPRRDIARHNYGRARM